MTIQKLPAEGLGLTSAQRKLIMCGVALVLLAPIASGFGAYALVGILAGLGAVIGAAVFLLPSDSSSSRRRRVTSAAVLLIAAGGLTIAWSWFATFALFAGELLPKCREAMGYLDLPGGVTVVKSLVPPAVLCFPTGEIGLPTIATPLGDVLGWSICLGIVWLLLGIAVWRSFRGIVRSPRADP